MNFNLNHEFGISLKEFKYGNTQNVEVKIGRKTFLVDINKNCSVGCIDVYRKLSKDRSNFSKYDPEANLHSAFVKNDAYLCRNFFEDIENIEKAQYIFRKYGNIIDK